MFAIVDVAGQQVKVNPLERIFIPRLSETVGSMIKLDRVLLLADDKSVDCFTHNNYRNILAQLCLMVVSDNRYN